MRQLIWNWLPAGEWSVIAAHGGSCGNAVNSCLIYSTAPTNGGYGIMTGDSGTTVKFSREVLHDKYSHAVKVAASETATRLRYALHAWPRDSGHSDSVAPTGRVGSVA